ncbi:hypothetical protein HLH25_16020 [Gluconacetobacter sp. 1a LMG 1728]|nr:hypothetical protein [Gluconacetobacter dulcium]
MEQPVNDKAAASFFAMLDLHANSIKATVRPDAKVTIIVRAPEALPHEAMISTNDNLAVVRVAVAHFAAQADRHPADGSYERGVQNGREAGITIGRHQAQAVIAAAIKLAWSEEGTASILNGRDPAAFDPWPEMDALLTALEQARPGWRTQARMEGTLDG